MNTFDVILLVVSALAGSVAAVTGFGIGSILTPLLALQTGTKLAVVAISIPHFIATFIRFWLIRSHVNRSVLVRFGIASAVGGLAGALLHTGFQSRALTIVFGALLLFAGFMGVTGLAQRMRFHGPVAWIAGALSGIFGGLVGNQGGIRSAALMSFDLSKEALVATATAIGVIVDLARMPVYLATEWSGIESVTRAIALASVGVVLGTAIGVRFLRGMPERAFRKILGGLIFALGLYMIFSAA